MKLCPLFEGVLSDSSYTEHAPHYLGVLADCNDALPREAIEASIHALTFLEFPPHSEAVTLTYIEQLRAMLPKE